MSILLKNGHIFTAHQRFLKHERSREPPAHKQQSQPARI
jgi:hypothetical protein